MAAGRWSSFFRNSFETLDFNRRTPSAERPPPTGLSLRPRSPGEPRRPGDPIVSPRWPRNVPSRLGHPPGRRGCARPRHPGSPGEASKPPRAPAEVAVSWLPIVPYPAVSDGQRRPPLTALQEPPPPLGVVRLRHPIDRAVLTRPVGHAGEAGGHLAVEAI